MRTIIKIALLSVLTLSDTAQCEESVEGITFSGDLFSRTKLTGDWGGIRNDMAEHGVTLDLDATHVTQHVASGGYDGSLLSQFHGNRISQSLPGITETESDAMFNMLLNVDTG
jgi:porin